jgi:hypothetical protein
LSDDGLSRLREELGAAPPEGLTTTLSDAELRALADTIHDARRRQSAALRAAGDQALDRLPMLVRVAVRKLIGA